MGNHGKDEQQVREICQVLQQFLAPGQVTELRALSVSTPRRPAPHTVSGYFDDSGKLAAEAARLSPYARGVYFIPNPVNPALLARAANRVHAVAREPLTSDADILQYRWLLLDADPVRPAGISSTEAEHRAALSRVQEIRAVLSAQGWPEPLVADSGNGGHLLYRIDLPVRDSGLVGRVLKALAFRFDDAAVTIDQRVFNPARIWKLYGTWSRKGDDTPDRPHRPARLLETPGSLTPVPRELLEALAAHLPEASRQESKRPDRKPEPFDLEAWIANHGLELLGPTPWGDGRKWIFRVCPWNESHTNRSAYLLQLGNGAIAAGCLHNGCRDRDWHALRDRVDPGWRERQAHRAGSGSANRAGSMPSDALAPELAGILAELERLRPPAEEAEGDVEAQGKKRARPDRKAVEDKALALVEDCARLTRAELMQVVSLLRDLGVSRDWVHDWQAAVQEARKRSRKAVGEEDPPAEHPSSCPYIAREGQIFYLAPRRNSEGETEIQESIVADFEARIVEEATDEAGARWFTLEGRTKQGLRFRLEIPAIEFADDRILLAALEQAAGARAPVRAGQAKHLRPAIKLLTDCSNDLCRVRRYERTGWSSGHFLIPGREREEVSIHLPRKLPYRIPGNADPDLGLEALAALLESMLLTQTTVAATVAFTAPLASLAGWRGERYCLFIAGRTGSLKSSWAQVLMCLYGSDFIRDELLIKWGEGATRNAVMTLASHAYDLPFLIDNYKPITGGGAKDFVNLIHNILEGGEKDRLTPSARLKDTRPVFCWPLATGEDVPDKDPASLARILVVHFGWQRGEANPRLSRAQALSPHLPAIGRVWLDWLESEEGIEIVRLLAGLFAQKRAEWAEKLRRTRSDMANILRVASNLATSQLTWLALRRHPQLGEIAEQYAEDHAEGLEEVATYMAHATARALEATRWLEALRALLGGRCILLDHGEEPRDSEERDRYLGWRGPDGSLYIVPELARKAIEQLLGRDGLGELSERTLHAQLEELGMLASKGRNQRTIQIRVGSRVDGQRPRVLHLKAEALGGEESLER
ncbi:MAG: DUF927 domain-containing protein [Chloroflexi bacterium]|nr:DUF927 domain-containing protein [Chloroflexota bacterium]